jgi:hypothetical protein
MGFRHAPTYRHADCRRAPLPRRTAARVAPTPRACLALSRRRKCSTPPHTPTQTSHGRCQASPVGSPLNSTPRQGSLLERARHTPTLRDQHKRNAPLPLHHRWRVLPPRRRRERRSAPDLVGRQVLTIITTAGEPTTATAAARHAVSPHASTHSTPQRRRRTTKARRPQRGRSPHRRGIPGTQNKTARPVAKQADNGGNRNAGTGDARHTAHQPAGDQRHGFHSVLTVSPLSPLAHRWAHIIDGHRSHLIPDSRQPTPLPG